MTDRVVTIDLWLWSLDCDPDESLQRRAILSEAERVRADRFVHDRDRNRFIAGRARMREILADRVGSAAEALPLLQGPNGKPFLPDGPIFNLSHAAGLAALVVTADKSVWLGVDIEGARPVEPGLDAYAFAPEEQLELRAVDPQARNRAFFLGWTRKEAVVKATGAGLHADLKSFAITLDPALPACLIRIDGQRPDAWRLHDFSPRPDLAGAIACMTGGRDILVNCRN